MKKTSLFATLILVPTLSFSFSFNNFKKELVDKVKEKTDSYTKSDISSLSDSTISDGLKEALKIGVDYSVKKLGVNNGYLNNSLVKIPLPKNLQKVEKAVRKVGGDKKADDLIKAMNKAATKAAPKTVDIFIKTISKMNIKDAKEILKGDDTAATKYFKKNANSSLKELIKPIVKETMKENKVATYYNSFNKYYSSYGSKISNNSSVKSYAKKLNVESYLPTASATNLNDYITQKAIDGLFKMISKKEIEIRNNPLEQTSSLLKKVFAK